MRFQRLCIALTTTGAVALALPAAAQNAANTNPTFDAEAAIEGFLTDTALLGADEATVSSIAAEGDTVTATGVSMKWAVPFAIQGDEITANIDVRLPTLTVTGLAETADGHSAEKIDMPSGTFQVRMSGTGEPFLYVLRFEGYSFDNAEWARFPTIGPDPAAPISRFAPVLDWAATQSYERVSVGGMTMNMAAGDERQDQTYGAISYGPVVNGTLERFEYGPFSVSQTGDIALNDGKIEDAQFTINYGKIVGTGIDIKPMIAFLTGNGGQPGLQNMMKSLTVDGITMESGSDFNFSLGPILTNDVSVDASRGPFLQKLDPLFIALAEGTEPAPTELINLMLDAYGAYGIGRYAFTDIAFKTPEGSGEVAEFGIENLSATGLGRLILSGFNFEGAEGAGSIGTFEIADVLFPERAKVMDVVLGSMMGIPFGPDNLDALPTVGSLTLRGLSAPNAAAGGPPLKLDAFEMDLGGFIAAIPTRLAVAIEGMEFPLAMVEDPRAQMVLTAVGADPVKVDGNITLEWSEMGGAVTMANDLAVDKVGRIVADAAVGGIPRTVFENPMRAQEALATATIGNMDIRFTDAGVVPFVLDMMSQQAGISKEELAQGLGQQVSMQVGMLTGDPELAGTISAAIREFLSNPENFAVAVSPPSPVPVAQLIGAAMTAPQQIPELLNLSITANQ